MSKAHLPALSLHAALLLSCFGLVTPSLRAGPVITFDDNPITYSGVSANVGGAYTTITESPSNKNKLNDGYSISDLSYSALKRAAGDGIVVSWTSFRMFNLSEAANVRVTITGDTGIVFGTGSIVFDVFGSIDGPLVTQFTSNLTPPGNLGLTWNMSGVRMNLAAGDHALRMTSRVAWSDPLIHDKVDVSSLYQITVSVVPEPASLQLGAIATIGLGVACFRSSRTKRQARKSCA
jgi:hypothetical protein